MRRKKMQFDVVVLGAGAAGLMCALTAAQRGRSVLILEKSNKVGKKILMSGGGRCNFTNLHITADNYLCANPHFVKSALQRYSQWDFIGLVEDHRVDYEERKHGELFCVHSAKDILKLLLDECERAEVTVQTHCDVKKVSTRTESSTVTKEAKKSSQKTDSKKPTPNYFISLESKDQMFSVACSSLVVATGALSIPTLGGSGQGYDIGEQFALPIIDRRAGLVPLMFSDAIHPLCDTLSGLALPVTVSSNGESFTENLLFTHRGISGPAILQISNYWRPGDVLGVDILPGLNATDWLIRAKHQAKHSHIRSILGEHLPKALIKELEKLWWLERSQTPLAQWPDKALKELGQQLNQWQLKPSATEGYRTAEVTLGGVDTDFISSKTMEVKHQKGLFFVGEVMDVTGHLGGFNFQWAWSSGYTAGIFA